MVVQVSAYMVELHNDTLYDLFLPLKQRKQPPRLDIKRDSRGMILIHNAVVLPAADAAELQNLYDKAISSRHVRATAAPVDSARAHLMFVVMVETRNKISGAVTVGKMCLVDLAGSEAKAVASTPASRASTPGGDAAGSDNEVRAVAKSLGALGDVVTALSRKEASVPYRQNKLTLMLSDALGGSAKVRVVHALKGLPQTPPSGDPGKREAPKNTDGVRLERRRISVQSCCHHFPVLFRTLWRAPRPTCPRVRLLDGTPGRGPVEDQHTDGGPGPRGDGHGALLYATLCHLPTGGGQPPLQPQPVGADWGQPLHSRVCG